MCRGECGTIWLKKWPWVHGVPASPKTPYRGTWGDNSVQFPRLLAEISANVGISSADWAGLCESMDLNHDELEELFNRAHEEWERIKENT